MIKWFQKVFEGRRRQVAEENLYKDFDNQLIFATSDPLTLGVEFELAVLDKDTLLPANEAQSIVTELASPQIKEEVLQHMVEVTSAIAQNVQEAEAQVKDALSQLSVACAKRNLLISGTARPPTIKSQNTKRTPNDRLARLANERKVFHNRFDALGMHIHLGMKDAEWCVKYNNFFMHFSPHLIALSASSPFEEGVFTGMASIRPSIAESMPIAGIPYHYTDWHDYVRLCHALFKAGSIQKLKDMWWDLRPSPLYGTLEIRVCDQPATLSEGLAIVAFVHLLSHWFEEHQSWLDEMPRPNVWRLRENKWRAMRYGLDADLVIDNQGETRPLCDDIRLWLDRVAPFVEKFGYQGYIETLKAIMEKGNSTKRQQRLWEASEDIALVARFNCDEYEAQAPQWDKLSELIASSAKPKLSFAAEETALKRIVQN